MSDSDSLVERLRAGLDPYWGKPTATDRTRLEAAARITHLEAEVDRATDEVEKHINLYIETEAERCAERALADRLGKALLHSTPEADVNRYFGHSRNRYESALNAWRARRAQEER